MSPEAEAQGETQIRDPQAQAMTTRMRTRTIIVTLAATLAPLALAITTLPGCAAPAKPTPPVAVDPTDPLAPPPQPDVGACVAKIENMQGALSMAKIGAAILVSRDSKYGPAVKVALVALDAALANARVQCGTGSVDGWAVALAAFDAAFEQLAEAGDEFAAATSPNDIMPPPPYPYSLDYLNYRVFESDNSTEAVIE